MIRVELLSSFFRLYYKYKQSTCDNFFDKFNIHGWFFVLIENTFIDSRKKASFAPDSPETVKNLVVCLRRAVGN